MSVLIAILFIWGLCKLIGALARNARASNEAREERARIEASERASQAKYYLNAVNRARTASDFFDNYRALESQVNAMNKARFASANQRLINSISTVNNSMVYKGSESYELLLRNAINRQCADTSKDIRTTYKYSNSYRDAAYNKFMKQMQAFDTYFTNVETRELVNRCIARVQYEYNGAKRQLPFHNDAADYERSLLTPKLRYDILRRDGFRCTICGRGQEDGVKLHVDHIKPVSKGGRTTPDNLRTLCQDCNLGKGDSYMEGGYN